MITEDESMATEFELLQYDQLTRIWAYLKPKFPINMDRLQPG